MASKVNARSESKRASTASDVIATSLEKLLIDGALPGDLEGFTPKWRSEAAGFVSKAIKSRKAGTAAVALESFADEQGLRQMRLGVAHDDMPFLVDSVAATFAAHGLVIDRMLHPIVKATRDSKGNLTAIAKRNDEKGMPESIMYMEVDRADARMRNALVEEIQAVLKDVRWAVGDWHTAMDIMRRDAEGIDEDEGRALLNWFLDRNFTLLGHETHDRKRSRTELLGISKSEDSPPLLGPVSIQRAFDYFEKGGRAPLTLKSNRLSTVHRRQPLDLILVPLMDGKTVKKISIHAGLWTSAALAAPPEQVPVLRAMLARVEAKFGFDPSSHAGKALSHSIGALPHDIILGFTEKQLEDAALTSMSVTDRPRPKLTLIESPLQRHLFTFVWLPRDELTTARRLEIGKMLEASAPGPIINWTVDMNEGDVALIRYTLDLPETGMKANRSLVDEQLKMMVRGWSSAVERNIVDSGQDTATATRLALRFADAFPASYRSTYGAAEASSDILRLASLENDSGRRVRLYRKEDDAPGQVRLKIYRLGGTIPLSDAVPVMEAFGFRVLEEMPTALDKGVPGYIHDFLLESADQVDTAGLIARAGVIEATLEAVLRGEAENDAFNRLIISAGLAARDVVYLRAWFRYLRQTGMAYGLLTVVDALARYPAITDQIIALFHALHNPGFKGSRATATTQGNKAIETGLASVKAIDDDRILRRIAAVVMATLRTNAFSPAAAEALAFKLDSAQVPGLPAPLPWREIWVYSPRVEGIHLRAGPVARGGLRWSDRRDDFRTEILGLMKAQRVKNAVIVPTGAKGGFYPKMLPDMAVNRDAWFAEGTESYRIFIRSLLSVTDNLVKGKVVHPDHVVIRDGDDPYFVVAADKGTATFSDVANAIALERNFWLGDAFASGGSVGYDHKAMGITAKGAWISVQRHFKEMGVDVQTESVRVVGCGDMSGDVFGNGMLLSKAIKLVAAFDHRHIFIDPDPDPAKSWAERERMFNLPRSSWDDYNKKLISKGGGVYARSEKSITVSDEAVAALGLSTNTMEPAELISAILRSPADLIWFGGIGTYIKAAAENNAAVGDAANDRLRVDAEDLQARVIGEGANLGVTQAARIAFSKHGGRINTDFIDNSAGVDCSDNEVNIKIALNREMNEGRLSYAKRNTFLRSMTDQVSELVLDDNRFQALAISVAEEQSKTALGSYVRQIDQFEATGRLDRKVEGLPANEDLLRRAGESYGLTRPELAVLLSTAKLTLQDALEDAEMGLDPFMDDTLVGAFPPKMRKPYHKAILDHQLRNEIVATKIANRIVNRLGIAHPFELAEEEGATLAEIANAFVIVERLFDLEVLFDELDTAPMAEETRLKLLDQVAGLARSHMADLLRSGEADKPRAEAVKNLAPTLSRLEKMADKLLSDVGIAEANAIEANAIAEGVSPPIAAKLRFLFTMDGAIGLASLAKRRDIDPVKLTRAFIDIGVALGLNWLQTSALKLSSSDPWERLLISGLARDFQQMRLDFLERTRKGDPSAHVSNWLDRNKARVQQFRSLVESAKKSPHPTPAMFAQLASQARVLLGR